MVMQIGEADSGNRCGSLRYPRSRLSLSHGTKPGSCNTHLPRHFPETPRRGCHRRKSRNRGCYSGHYFQLRHYCIGARLLQPQSHLGPWDHMQDGGRRLYGMKACIQRITVQRHRNQMLTNSALTNQGAVRSQVLRPADRTLCASLNVVISPLMFETCLPDRVPHSTHESCAKRVPPCHRD